MASEHMHEHRLTQLESREVILAKRCASLETHVKALIDRVEELCGECGLVFTHEQPLTGRDGSFICPECWEKGRQESLYKIRRKAEEIARDFNRGHTA